MYGSSMYGTPNQRGSGSAQPTTGFSEGFSFGSASTSRSNGLGFSGDRGFGNSGDSFTMTSSHGSETPQQQKYLPTFLAPSPTSLETSASNLRTSQNYRTPRRESDPFGVDYSFYGDEAPAPYYNPIGTTSTPQQRRTTFNEPPTQSRFSEYSPGGEAPLRSSNSGFRLHQSKEQIPGASLYDLEDIEPRNDSPPKPSTLALPSNDMPTLDYPAFKPKKPSSSQRDERWVTVFGFPVANTSLVLRKFQTYGDIIHHHASQSNWIHIQYATIQQAKNALKKNGTMVGNLMIGVCECQDNVAIEHSVQSGSISEVKKRNQIHSEYSVEPSDIIKRAPQVKNSLWSLFLEYVFGV